jgi:hypothetical protein
MIEPKRKPGPTQIADLSKADLSKVLPFKLQARQARTEPRMEILGLSFTWETLERQLCELAVTPAQRRLAPSLVSATRKQAAFKPSEQVLREVLCIASVLMDEAFHPASDPPASGEGAMS